MAFTSIGLRAGLAGLGLRCTPQRSCFASRSFSTRINGSLLRPKVVAPLYLSRRTITSKTPVEDTVADTLPVYDASLPIAGAISDPLSLTDTIVQAIPPVAYGDFAHLGLTTGSPIGLVAWTFELINVSTGLPWFWTIVAGSALWRMVCVPFALHGVRAAARMRPYQPQILKLQERITEAKGKQDMLTLQRASIEMRQVYKEARVNPFTGMIVPMLVQVPVSIGVFFALKRMAAVPVMQMQDGGVGSWFWANDLTMVDPTYALPALFCGLMNLQIMVGARDMNMDSSPGAVHMLNGMRLLSIFAGFFMASLPSGLLLALVTTSALTVAQSILIRNPVVRNALNIPLVPKGQGGRLPSMLESFRFVQKWFAEVQQRT